MEFCKTICNSPFQGNPQWGFLTQEKVEQSSLPFRDHFSHHLSISSLQKFQSMHCNVWDVRCENPWHARNQSDKHMLVHRISGQNWFVSEKRTKLADCLPIWRIRRKCSISISEWLFFLAATFVRRRARWFSRRHRGEQVFPSLCFVSGSQLLWSLLYNDHVANQYLFCILYHKLITTFSFIPHWEWLTTMRFINH